MPEYDNTNSGVISKNDRKRDDKDADIAGYINVDGKDYWLNGWLRTKKSDGSKFYSLKVKPKQQRAQEIQRNVSSEDFLDDTIPF